MVSTLENVDDGQCEKMSVRSSKDMENPGVVSMTVWLLLLVVGVTESKHPHNDNDDSTTSIIIIMGFLAVILILSGIGIACSYLCYKRSEQKAMERTREIMQIHPRRPLEAHPLARGVPNWYGPPPDEAELAKERHQLLERIPPPR